MVMLSRFVALSTSLTWKASLSQEFVWEKIGGGAFGPHNTVHIDDLSRNFALNPQSGLKCSACTCSIDLAPDRIAFFVRPQSR